MSMSLEPLLSADDGPTFHDAPEHEEKATSEISLEVKASSQSSLELAEPTSLHISLTPTVEVVSTSNAPAAATASVSLAGLSLTPTDSVASTSHVVLHRFDDPQASARVELKEFKVRQMAAQVCSHRADRSSKKANIAIGSRTPRRWTRRKERRSAQISANPPMMTWLRAGGRE